MARRRLRGEFDTSVEDAAKVFTDELDDMSSVRYSIEKEGKSTVIQVGFVELATWVYPTIALLLGLVLAAFLVPDEYLPDVLSDLGPVLGIPRWWAVIFSIVAVLLCYALSQVTTLIPGGEINITPDGPQASNVEVRDVTEAYLYRALRNIVHDHDRELSAARAKAEENQLTLGSVLGAGMMSVSQLGRTDGAGSDESEGQSERDAGATPESPQDETAAVAAPEQDTEDSSSD